MPKTWTCPNCLSEIVTAEQRYCKKCKTKGCKYCYCKCELERRKNVNEQ